MADEQVRLVVVSAFGDYPIGAVITDPNVTAKLLADPERAHSFVRTPHADAPASPPASAPTAPTEPAAADDHHGEG